MSVVLSGTAQQAVRYARSFVGKIHETPPGSNVTPIGDRFGWNGVPYCAEGIWVVLDHVHVPVYKTASAHLMIDSGHQDQFGRLVWDWTKLRPGDVIGWNFDPDPNVIRNIHHVSMATGTPDEGAIPHVGFNTSSPSGGGTEWNGEGCWEKSYPADYFCVALRPPYAKSKGGKTGDDNGKVRFILTLGDKGSDVRLWQKLLNIVDKAHLTVDGEFGKSTEKATMKWQKAHHRIPDGSVRLAAIRELEQKIAKL